MSIALLAAALVAQAAPASTPAGAAPAVPATMTRPISAAILEDAPANSWRAIAPEDLLVLDLADGARVVIALAPAYAPQHVANIRRLARSGWWDGTSINRVQDNYVVQWGDATEKKPLPPATIAKPDAEYQRPVAGIGFRPLGFADTYARATGHDADSWSVARDGATAWLPHCYASVGVGRDMPPDTGTGAELYAVIGQAPRHLDRNITVVGRVLDGMERLAARPRGTGPLGFYADPAERTGIVRVRLAADLPAAERPAFEVLRSGSPAFARWIAARANRRDPFFVRPAGAVDICNATAPVRAIRR